MSEDSVILRCEYKTLLAQVVFSDPQIDAKHGFADCALKIETCSFTFTSGFCIGGDGLAEFLRDLQILIDTNNGNAVLRDYCEESSLTLTALGKASGKIVLEGEIVNVFPAADHQLWSSVPPVGHLRSGAELRFGGIETDQSFVRGDMVGFKHLLNLIRKAAPRPAP